jgi:hypothetical protein
MLTILDFDIGHVVLQDIHRDARHLCILFFASRTEVACFLQTFYCESGKEQVRPELLPPPIGRLLR